MKPYTASLLRYDDKQGRCGKLLGLITFSDGKSLKVWSDELHKACQHLKAFPPHPLTYTFRHSAKWGDALETVASTLTDYELADLARSRDEQRGRIAPNSWLGHKIAKGVGRHEFDDVRRG